MTESCNERLAFRLSPTVDTQIRDPNCGMGLHPLKFTVPQKKPSIVPGAASPWPLSRRTSLAYPRGAGAASTAGTRGERSQGAEEGRSRAQAGAATALSSMPVPLAVQEEKERRSRVGAESSSSWSRCRSAFDASGGSSSTVWDEEAHTQCLRETFACSIFGSRWKRGGNEIQFSVIICAVSWSWCSTVLRTMHFEFEARFESSVGDSLRNAFETSADQPTSLSPS
jgi:hypothetical protein